MPDDWRYQFIVDSLDALSEESDPDDIQPGGDIYTHDLTGWIHSRVDRLSAERTEVLSSVRWFLESMIEESDDDDDAPDDDDNS